MDDARARAIVKSRPLLDTDALAKKYRQSVINTDTQRLLITNYKGTDQEKDLTEASNCSGVGRVRHFRRRTDTDWPDNPLPIDPACKVLRLPCSDTLRAQVFQVAACNWRCWYCFVPFDLLAADEARAEWLTVSQLVERYLSEPNHPAVMDLSGGEPSLVPEWVPWTMRELLARGLDRAVYVWSDDNLSSSYFWDFMSARDIELIASYRNYGRVCCFKGIDAQSFSFNTGADPSLFERQFQLFKRLLPLGIDLFAYVTFTVPDLVDVQEKTRRFVDRLQSLDINLPLRTVPLEVKVFSPVERRLVGERRSALEHQKTVVEIWRNELSKRFTSSDLTRNIADIPIGARRI